MKCEEAMEATVDRLTGDLDAAAAEALRQHFAECAGCAAEAAVLQALWDGLAASGEETPSSTLRRRFDDMLAREIALATRGGERARPAAETPVIAFDRASLSARSSARARDQARDRRSLRPAALGFALAAALAVTLGAGVYIGSTTASRRGADDLAELRDEVHSLRSTVALALLTEPSASDRLSGVAYGRELQSQDRRVGDALFERLLEDPNVNVRLAALDALREVATRPETRERLLASIPAQDSPLVQISAIDVLLDDTGGQPATGRAADGARADLAQLADDPALDEVVRGYLRDRLERSSP